MLDLDDFARFNKDYGELTGAAVLRSFADIASSCIRKIDWIARYGGDEFRLVVPGDLNDAVIVAERIRANVDAAVVSAYDVNTIRITVSIGVTELNRTFPGRNAAPRIVVRC
jgi:diguanylate cyclase (GGDEF)-like protein